MIAGKNHYGLAQVYDDRIVVTIHALDGRELDEFALPLRPTTAKQGGGRNLHSMELPPLAELPQFLRQRACSALLVRYDRQPGLV